MSARALLFGVVLGLALAVWFFWEPRRPPVVASPVIASAEEAPDAAVEAAATQPSVEAAAAPAGVSFNDGFCSGMGGESYRVRSTLPNALLAEARRRDGANTGTDPETELLARFRRGERGDALLAEAKTVAAQKPDSPWPQMLIALAEKDLDHAEEQVLALRRARERLPNDAAIAYALAAATWNGPDLDEPVDALGTFLAVEPTPAVSRLRARLVVQRDIQQGYRRELRDGITVLWPDTLPARLADDIAGRVDRGLDDAAALTGTRRRKTLTLVVYPSRSELLAVACVRAWTGALFDGVLRVVADAPGDEVDGNVLKHETLHAQLSPLLPQAPKWFHEGLAQSFAQERKPKRTWKLMVKNRSYIPFGSLDGTFQDFATNADADLAYAQSYAMVELMRALNGDGSIPTAIAAFQAGASTPAALAKACGRAEVTGADLLGFIEGQ